MNDSGQRQADTIFLMGPTAAGKTAVAMQVAERFRVGLISVDSGQVYRGMDIGTAKPEPGELARFPHALIDIREPDEPYSADDFCHEALLAMQQLVTDGRMPLLVGGTMFYYRALQYGLPALPSADPETRAAIAAEAGRQGWHALHAQLAEIDPAAARRIDRNDRQRIMRALEIYRLSGNPPSDYPPSRQQVIPYRVLKIGVWPAQRRILHERIEARLEQMFAAGFIDEVKKLQDRDLDPALPAMRAVGYRQVLEYLRGEVNYHEMRTRCLASTRQLAKRQLTWLRHDPDVHWFDSEMPDYVEKVLDFVQKNTSVHAIDPEQ